MSLALSENWLLGRLSTHNRGRLITSLQIPFEKFQLEHRYIRMFVPLHPLSPEPQACVSQYIRTWLQHLVPTHRRPRRCSSD